MRSLAGVCFVAVGLLASSPASAQDVESLKKELEQMRQQFESMKEGYEKAMNQMGERIKALESRQAPAAAPPAVAAPPGTAPPVLAAPPATVPPAGATPPATAPPAIAAPPATAPPSAVAAPAGPPPTATPVSGQAVAQTPAASPNLTELARPREPFSLYQQRGAGQLLFDIGVTGDFIGDLTQNNVQQAQGGTFPGLENYVFAREVELSLFGQIDPYARAEVRFEASQEQRGQSPTVTLAEANLTLMTLPFDTQAKLGQMRNRFGLTNQIHEHDLPFVDRPDVLVEFLGQDGLVEKGAEFTWVPPLPFYVELLGGVFNGDNDTAFGFANIKKPLVTGRVKTFFELGDYGAIQLGASVANGLQPNGLTNTLVGADMKYKYVPDGWQHPLLTVAGEWLYQLRRVSAPTATDPSQTQTLNRSGWYLFGELQPVQFGALSRFSLGFRYDWTEYPTNPGQQWAAEPFITFMPSEFLRFRLVYKHTHGNTPGCCTNTNVGSARIKDEIFLQSTFILGAHPAHPF